MKQEHGNTTIEWLRIVSAFMIVCIHAKFAPHGKVLDLAVPMFSAIAGYFWVVGLGAADGVGIDRLLRRVKRLAVPLVVWTILYWVLNNVIFDGLLNRQPIEWPSVSSVVSLVLRGGAAAHLWFLPSLLYGSILIFIGFLIFKARVSRLIYLSVLSLAAASFVFVFTYVYTSFSTSATLIGWIKLYLARLILFASLGGLIALICRQDEKRNWFWFDFILLCLGLVAFLVFRGLYAGTLLVMSILGLSISFPHLPLPLWARSCAVASMDIYLAHVALVVAISYILERTGRTSAVFGLASVLLAFALSWAFSLVKGYAWAKLTNSWLDHWLIRLGCYHG